MLLRTLAAHYPRVWRLVTGSGVLSCGCRAAGLEWGLAAATCHKGLLNSAAPQSRIQRSAGISA